MDRFEFLTFDCYGTLIDWRAGIERSLGSLLRARGYRGSASLFSIYELFERVEEIEYRPYREVLIGTMLRVAAHVGVDLGRAEAEEFADSVPSWPAFVDSRPVLRELGRRGLRRYILSNVDHDILGRTIARQGLQVDGFVTADEVRSYKPAEAHWRRFFEVTGSEPRTVLHVAQSVHHDIVPASRLGLQTVWVNRYRQPLPPSVRPTYGADDLRILLTTVAGFRDQRVEGT